MTDKERIPYKIYLEESEMPKAWMNLRAFMKNKPDQPANFLMQSYTLMIRNKEG